MELCKNIFFNTDKLIENQTVKISYTGTFFQDGSKEVYIHYGFGLLWENIGEIKMEKTDLGFKNENDCWDNNNNCNYSFPIEKFEVDNSDKDLSLIVASSRKLRKSYIWSKKIKLAIYKIITYIPKIISGNYKRKINND